MRSLRLVMCLLIGQFAIVGMTFAEPPAARNFVAHLSGDQEVFVGDPSPSDSGATGQAIFKLSKDGTELSFRLIVANIENVVQAHIHMGPPGVNGAVVVFLFGLVPSGGGRVHGVLAIGTVTKNDLVGPLVGQDLSVLVQAMRSGGTYVNVHTNDGIDPPNQGPGDFPGGEVRGQIQPAGA